MKFKNISTDKLEKIYQSARLQLENGRAREKTLVTLYGKGLEEDEAEIILDKAY